MYFDPLTKEDVEALIATEKPYGVVVQFGGQTAIKLIKHLTALGVRILGTSAADVDAAEDRELFDELLEKCSIPRPKGSTVFTTEEALKTANELGYPVDVYKRQGQTHKEDIITGGNAAAAGGVTAVACMPNTNPTIDNAETVHYILEKAKEAKTRVYPVGSITKGLGGAEMCDFEELHKAGCVAVSDDGRPVKNARIMAEAMVKAHYAGMKVISHCEDLDIVNGGIMNYGEVSKELGVKGIHRLSEDIITEREITLAADLEVPIHIAHVSTAQSMQNIRTAARFGTMVTCETAPHLSLIHI